MQGWKGENHYFQQWISFGRRTFQRCKYDSLFVERAAFVKTDLLIYNLKILMFVASLKIRYEFSLFVGIIGGI